MWRVRKGGNSPSSHAFVTQNLNSEQLGVLGSTIGFGGSCASNMSTMAMNVRIVVVVHGILEPLSATAKFLVLNINASVKNIDTGPITSKVIISVSLGVRVTSRHPRKVPGGIVLIDGGGGRNHVLLDEIDLWFE